MANPNNPNQNPGQQNTPRPGQGGQQPGRWPEAGPAAGRAAEAGPGWPAWGRPAGRWPSMAATTIDRVSAAPPMRRGPFPIEMNGPAQAGSLLFGFHVHGGAGAFPAHFLARGARL